jgi:hypothetical protein
MPQGNPFSDLIPGYAPQAAPRAPALEMVVPPRPRQPTPQTPAQAEADTLDVELKKQELADKQRKSSQAQKDLGRVRDDMVSVLDNAFRAKELSRNGWLTTGFGAPLGRMIGNVVGGTDASALKGALNVIGSNTAFETLQRMRQESPTGGAVGNVSDKDIELLKSTIASLDPSLPDKDFQQSMQRVVDTYGRVLMKMPGGRAIAISRGWLPKSSAASAKQAPAQPAKPRVVDFNDLPE